MATLSSSEYYEEYHGHKVEHLETIVATVPRGRGVIYLVGDSTLDNKYWLHSHARAINGYERVLSPTQSVPDCCHQINEELIKQRLGDSLVCVNTAIEESTLGLRERGKLLPQDEFVRSHITERDVLVVSCGGNDIALRPTLLTIAAVATLLSMPKGLIKCGPWGAPGLAHFLGLFRDQTKRFIETLISTKRPRVVVVCMLYYLDEKPGGSWADFVLQKLGYDKDPTKLQLVMRQVFEHATSTIRIDGVEVIPVALYEALDGTISADYEQRVEPSVQGGKKMAELIVTKLLPALEATNSDKSSSARSQGREAAPVPSNVVSMPKAVHA
eukprot:CAMPEP_0115865000 /NCGR_PEP_ID=MMETSP0287-20121206/19490_1 /TAXON_ID=412157 /ORGANISM="Chrysochromulina rotalis, Strain UIO044" /LENGTH=327 /DNA_ID=CAMNT_0003319487 /DNA_START=62 /DNA_END=1045 /DNA_ORIENTATION=+